VESICVYLRYLRFALWAGGRPLRLRGFAFFWVGGWDLCLSA
jgi:hypothetical protein